MKKTALETAGSRREESETPRLGELLVAEGVITRAQLVEALRIQRGPNRYAPLGDVLIAQKIISRDQLLAVLERHRRSSKLGDILLKSREIDRTQLQAALEEQQRVHRPLGEVLQRLGYITEERLRVALCRQLHVRFFSLDAMSLDPTLRNVVSETFAMKHRAVPVSRDGNLLILAMDDPTQTQLVDDLQRSSGLKIEVITSTSANITRALERLYRSEVPPARAAGTDVDVVAAASSDDVDGAPRSGGGESADQLVDKLLRIAVDHGVSAIHLETISTRLRVRLRIDGMLQQVDLGTLGDDLGRQRIEVLSRIKVLATLDVAERRRPQDGSFRARVQVDDAVVPVDVRVSMMPGYHGENAVIRILDPRRAPDSVAALKMSAPVSEGLQQLLRSSAGLLLVTGPTGAGKSTTLYAVLTSLYRPEIKIVTAEDPVEYVCPQFCQHEVDERVGNTFAAYTRSFLRHDPEVIMLGEIRDGDTAQLACRAARTGHLVVSTLHTDDAVSAVSRLTDLGVERRVTTSCLLGVLAQRLVREICWSCKEEYEPAPTQLESMFELVPRDLRWYRGRGCPTCFQTGYRSRLVLAELWIPGAADVALINDNAPIDVVLEATRKNTYSLAADAMAKLREGRTTLDEIARVLPRTALRELHSIVS